MAPMYILLLTRLKDFEDSDEAFQYFQDVSSDDNDAKLAEYALENEELILDFFKEL